MTAKSSGLDTTPETLTSLPDKQSRAFFVEAVDDGLALLGSSLRRTIYFQISKRYGLNREEIYAKPEIFHAALVDLFGSGHKVIEKKIVTSLYEKLDEVYEEYEGWTIVEYITSLKEDHRQNKRRG